MKLVKLLRFLNIHHVEMWFLPLVMCYYELVMHISTIGGYGFFSFAVSMLFALATGFLLQLIRSATSHRLPRRILTSVLLLVPAVFYSAFYIMFLQFKVYYDLNTIFFGAKDATQGFGGEIARLVTSFAGISHIFLFLLPFLLYVAGMIVLHVQHTGFRPRYHLKNDWR